MAKRFIVAAELTREEHKKLKALTRQQRPRIYIKDYVRELVVRAIDHKQIMPESRAERHGSIRAILSAARENGIRLTHEEVKAIKQEHGW